jgi:hypothetical protein
MLLFSAKTRQLLDVAVDRLPDQSRRGIWQAWAREHPRVRLPEGPGSDDGPPLPGGVADVALAALSEMADDMSSRRADMSEDEAADLENDLTYISAVTKLIEDASVR